MVLRKSFYIHWSAGRSPRVHEVNPGRDSSMVISAGFSSKLLASITGCLTAEYSSWITGLQKSSILSCTGGFSAAVSCSTV